MRVSTSLFICVVFAVVLIQKFCDAACSPAQEKGFEKHKKDHKRKYKDAAEESRRKANWCHSDDYITQHNAKIKTHKLGHNWLSEWSDEEFNSWNAYTPYKPTKSGRKPSVGRSKRQDEFGSDGTFIITNPCKPRPLPDVTWPVPDSVNWTAKGIIPIAKQQGSCGSCYAFAGVAALEAKYQIETGNPFNLSEEHAINCATKPAYGANYCNGGNAIEIINFVGAKGLHSADNYPYGSIQKPQQAPNPGCQAISAAPLVPPKTFPDGIAHRYILNNAPVDFFATNDFSANGECGLANAGNEEVLKQWVAKQPVAVSLFVGPDFKQHLSGVYTNASCPKDKNNHAVLLVGYGNDPATGLDYWIIKNSWGGYVPICFPFPGYESSFPDVASCYGGWGEGGYGLIQRGVNMCGIANEGVIPA